MNIKVWQGMSDYQKYVFMLRANLRLRILKEGVKTKDDGNITGYR